MDKTALGRDRVASLQGLLNNLLALDDKALQTQLKGGLFKSDGTFHLGNLAQKVGHDCQADTFRQNKPLRKLLKDGELKLSERVKAISPGRKVAASATTKQIGDQNEGRFLAWLATVGTPDNPAPASHTGRLYRRALWAIYSQQDLLDVGAAPTWWNKREAVRDALTQLDLKVVQKTVSIIDMASDSIADDMEDSMTSALVRKLRGEIKALKEQLAAEREARGRAELTAKQNELQLLYLPSGKMPHSH
jgi:hypothetical protein